MEIVEKKSRKCLELSQMVGKTRIPSIFISLVYQSIILERIEIQQGANDGDDIIIDSDFDDDEYGNYLSGSM
jgi:hypothetical protein